MAIDPRISELYTSILRRTPDQDGGEFWTAALANGTSLDTVRDAMLASEELGDHVGPVMRIYEAAFGRAPDQPGLTFWVNAKREGVSLQEIAQGFTGSAEFGARYDSSVSREDFIETLYTNALGRSSDAEGKAFWSATTLSNAELLTDFATSAEFVTRSDAPIKQFLTLTAAGDQPVGSLFALGTTLQSGSVIDGKIAGATVFIDLNDNGAQDAGEPSTTTNATGNFEFPAGTQQGGIVATGGTDISTGLAFTAKMSAPAGSEVVTPITTLIEKLADLDTSTDKTPAQKAADAQTQLKALLGLSDIEADLTTVDFVAESTAGDPTGESGGISDSEAALLYSQAIKVINFVKSTSSAVSGSKADGSVSEEDASDAAFDALLTQFVAQRDAGTTGVNLLNDAATLAAAAREAATARLGDDADAIAKADAIAGALGTVIAAGNTRIDEAVSGLGSGSSSEDTLNSLIQIVKVGKAVQGAVSDGFKTAAQSDDPQAAAATLQNQSTSDSGFSDDLVDGQDVGDINGDGSDDDPDTVQNDDSVAPPVTSPPPSAPVTNETFTFTTSTGEQITGGAGDDTFIGQIGGDEEATFNNSESMDGGAGQDTANLTVKGDVELPNSSSITNIETINLIRDGSAGNIDASVFGGAEAIWQIGAAGDIYSLAESQTAGFRNTDANTGSFAYGITAPDSATSVSVALDEAGKATSLVGAEVALNIVGKDVTTLNVSGTIGTGGGKLSLVGLPGGLETVNLALDSGTDLALYASSVAAFSSVTTFNASASSGDLVADFQGVPELALKSVTFGSGDDTITVGADGTFTLTGGAGADRFVIADDAFEATNSSLITIEDYNYDDGDVLAFTDADKLIGANLEVRSGTFENGVYSNTSETDYVVQYQNNDGGGKGTWDVWLKGAQDDNDAIKFDISGNTTEVGGINLSTYSTLHVGVKEGGSLSGGEGNDVLLGGDGAQTLTVGAGVNLLAGGEGDDTFAFTDATGEYIIADFNVEGDDTIDLNGLFGDESDAFEGALTAEPGAGMFAFDDDTDTLTVGLDGGGSISIVLSGVTEVTADDFAEIA